LKLIDRVKDKIKKIFPKKKFDVDLKQSAEAATLTSLPSITSIDKVTCYSSSTNDQVAASVSIVKNQILVQEILEEVPEVSRSEAIAVPTASCIDILTTTQKQVLERICHSRSDEQRFVERSRIILAYGSGKNVSQIAKEIGVDRKTVRKWCNRWNEVKMLLRKLEDDDDKKISEQAYRKIITEVLSDEYRSGAPPTFSPEQVTSLYAMACEVLDASPEGVSHWTHKMLADQMVKRGIVKSIAPSTVGRLLCEADLKPHKSRYWLNSPEHGTDSFQVSAEAICDIYKNAAALHQQGVHIISVDEKTGIQALERLNPTHAMEPNAQGSERREHSYDRHGTLTLIANFEVTTGQVIQPTIGETRTEEDFVKHIANTIDIDLPIRYSQNDYPEFSSWP